MKTKHDFKKIEDNLSHSSQKDVYKCSKCGTVKKMYIREEKVMNEYWFENYSSCI